MKGNMLLLLAERETPQSRSRQVVLGRWRNRKRRSIACSDSAFL